ncbi:MAG: di-trans,poly-cis-decaprenylcistransferase [Patescibacteria group bacterium]|nr:di-trans,poly-cis-decaprenylcistransferase [Patescibacteria group bacterium]MDE1971350.1 di-trans,poly-cis-decaprenylcistransferase [Patescibacteria group bacterium]
MKNIETRLVHLAIMQDGNRRWASAHGMKLWEGHKYGVSNFTRIAHSAFDKGIPFVTFWALSVDNIKKRTPEELSNLFSYIKSELSKSEFVDDLLRRDIRLRVVGKWRDFIDDSELKRTITELENTTIGCRRFHLTVLFAYDGKMEMLEAIRNIHGPISAITLKESLWTSFLPPVDLVIRTGGEPHWSAGFMMWLTADSQLYFTETKWPDFNEKELGKAVEDYNSRGRRYGK